MTMAESSLSLKIGDTDALGNRVRRVFMRECARRYAIWGTEKGEVVCDADDEALSEHPEIQEWVIKLVSLISLNPSLKTKYNSYVAHVYKMYFDGGAEACMAVLKSAYGELARQHQRWSKLFFLLGAAAVAALGVSTCALVYFRFNLSDLFKHFLAGVAVSTLGGFMSVAGGLRELSLDLEESTAVNALYRGGQVVVAMIAGIVATLLIRTGVLLSFLQQKDALSGFLVACFLAGFSVRFVYKALRSIENGAPLASGGATKHRKG